VSAVFICGDSHRVVLAHQLRYLLSRLHLLDKNQAIGQGFAPDYPSLPTTPFAVVPLPILDGRAHRQGAAVAPDGDEGGWPTSNLRPSVQFLPPIQIPNVWNSLGSRNPSPYSTHRSPAMNRLTAPQRELISDSLIASTSSRVSGASRCRTGVFEPMPLPAPSW
jgi:hypothetical protein